MTNYQKKQEGWKGWTGPKAPIEPQDIQDTIPAPAVIPPAPPMKWIAIMTGLVLSAGIVAIASVLIAVAVRLIRWGFGG